MIIDASYIDRKLSVRSGVPYTVNTTTTTQKQNYYRAEQ